MGGQAMVVVDASVWVARLVKGDIFHEAVRLWMADRRAENTLLVSPSLLLPEVSGALSRRTGDRELAQRTAEALEAIPGMRLVEMEQSLVGLAAILTAQLGLCGADAFYVATAEILDLPLCTLDEDQRQRAAYRVRLISPDVSDEN